MPKLVLFSKFFKDKSVPELCQLGKDLGVDGFDLCVRPGYPINPDNAATQLPEAVRTLRSAGLEVPMVTGNFDLLLPDHPTAIPLLSAMQKAGVGLLKLGYFSINPQTGNYWAEVERIRQAFGKWETLGRTYDVRICYHTHCHRCMGLNASALAHLIRGFDPRYIGAYLDPCHLCIEGEEFDLALAITGEYLGIVGLKDVLLVREPKNNHGRKGIRMVPAGEGMVDWTEVFTDLARVGFQGPLSIHAEFEASPDQFLPMVKQEVTFFRKCLKETFQ